MAAPTRRAAPVTSAALPASGAAAARASVPAEDVVWPVSVGFGMRSLDYDADAVTGRGSALSRAHCADARADPRGRGLDLVRAVHGARALRAGARVLQRGQREARAGRGLRDGPGNLRSLQPLGGAPMRPGP